MYCWPLTTWRFCEGTFPERPIVRSTPITTIAHMIFFPRDNPNRYPFSPEKSSLSSNFRAPPKLPSTDLRYSGHGWNRRRANPFAPLKLDYQRDAWPSVASTERWWDHRSTSFPHPREVPSHHCALLGL